MFNVSCACVKVSLHIPNLMPWIAGSSSAAKVIQFGDEDEEAEEGAEAPEGSGEAEATAADGAVAEDDGDDFNTAWDVLDVARVIYSKAPESDDASRLRLADVYMALADISLETGKT